MPDPNSTSRLYVVTGSRGAGKTGFCQQMAASARLNGLRVSGILSLPIFEGPHRVKIVAEDLQTGSSRILAIRKEPEQAGQQPATRHWQFDPQGIAFGNQALAASVPTDLLIVDELGTLEFEREQGWQAGLQALDSRQYTVAIAVIRPELLLNALQRWPEAFIVEIDTPEESQEKARQLAAMLFG